MNTMHIKTKNGYIDIYIDQFFPCSQARFRFLFKTIREFIWLNNVQEMTEQLKENFTNRISTMEIQKKIASTQYFAYMQEHADYRAMVESKKHPNGLPLTKEELKEFREKASAAKRTANVYHSNFNENERKITALKKNLEMLNSLEM